MPWMGSLMTRRTGSGRRAGTPSGRLLWSKKTRESDHPTAYYLPHYEPAVSTLLWTTWNVALEALGSRMPGRYLRLRFEDFVGRPVNCVESILRMI